MSVVESCTCCSGTCLAGDVKPGMMIRGQVVKRVQQHQELGIVVVDWGFGRAKITEAVHGVRELSASDWEKQVDEKVDKWLGEHGSKWTGCIWEQRERHLEPQDGWEWCWALGPRGRVPELWMRIPIGWQTPLEKKSARKLRILQRMGWRFVCADQDVKR